MSIEMDDNGYVTIVRGEGREKWRRAITPHDVDDLDEFGPPDMDAAFRRKVLKKWKKIPVLVDEPNPPPPTVDEIYDWQIHNNPVLKAFIEGVNDGTITPGAKAPIKEIESAVKRKMK